MAELSGTLRAAEFPRVVRFVSDLRQSGTLRIWSGRWAGELAFREGQLVAAVFGAERGVAALEAITLAVPQGRFAFVAGAAPAESSPDLDGLDLEAHLAALVAEAEALAHIVPSLAAVPSVDAVPCLGRDRGVALDRFTVGVLLAVDGQRSVADLAAAHGMVATFRAVAHLAQVGLIVLNEPLGGRRPWNTWRALARSSRRLGTRTPAAAPDSVAERDRRRQSGERAGAGQSARLAGGTMPHGPFTRFGQWLARYHRAVLVTWAVLIALSVPFAGRLASAVSVQGASKLVPGAESATAERLIGAAFPHRSEMQTFVVISAEDVRAPEVKRLITALDERITQRRAMGDITDAYSLSQAYQDILADYFARARVELRRQASDVEQAARDIVATPGVGDAVSSSGGLPPEVLASLSPDQQQAVPALLPLFTAGPPTDTQVQLALVDVGERNGLLQPAVASLLRDATAQGMADAELDARARQLAMTSDWREFPLAVPEELLRDLVSADRRATIVSVSFSKQQGPDPDNEWLRDVAASLVQELHLTGRVDVSVTGELALIRDTYKAAEHDNSRMEAFAYAVIVVVLLVFYRSIAATLLTVGLIVLAIYVGQAALFVLAERVSITQYTLTIMNFAMLGAGIDYSMLLVARYRQERIAGRPVRMAVEAAVAHAGESAFLAGAAVLLAFGATLLSPVDWVPPLGYGGIVGVSIILLAALTLTPSLLMLLGDRFLALGSGAMTVTEERGPLGAYLRHGQRLVIRAPLLVTLVFAAFGVAAVWPLRAYTPTADPVALSAASDSLNGFRLVARQWGDSWLFPTVIVGRLPAGSSDGNRVTADGYAAVEDLSRELAVLPGVARVQSLTRPFGEPLSAQEVTDLGEQVRREYLSSSGVARIVVILRDAPFSASAVATVGQVQRLVEGQRGGGTEWSVGGSTKTDLDYNAALANSFWRMIGLIAVGIFLLLALVLRSVLVPVRLILTVLLSNAWAVAITVALFQGVLRQSITSDVPIFLTVLMMGLGMDYEIFLITRVRENVLARQPEQEAVANAVLGTGRVINAAGLIMAGALGSMALSSTPMLQQYGVALSTAVLLDATVVRMFLVPATLLLLRKYNWWFPRLGYQWAPTPRLGC